MKKLIYILLIAILSITFLNGCKRELKITVNQKQLLPIEELNKIENTRDIIANKNKKEVALIAEEDKKWKVIRISEGTEKVEKTESEKYSDIGEVVFGKDKLFFSAQKEDGTWTFIEDFAEKDSRYNRIFNLTATDKDEIFFIGVKDEKSHLMKNYKEEISSKEILGLAISLKDNSYVYTTYENGDWFFVYPTGQKSRPLSYVSAPKYFKNGSWAVIVRDKNTNAWNSIINGIETPTYQAPSELSDFELNDKDGLSFIFSKKENGKWALVYPSKERSQEYNDLKELVYDSEGEIYYVDLPRYEGRLYEIRKGRREEVLAENLINVENLNIVEDTIAYKAKVAGGAWEVFIGENSLGNFKRTSNFYVIDNKLIFAAEDKLKGITYMEITAE